MASESNENIFSPEFDTYIRLINIFSMKNEVCMCNISIEQKFITYMMVRKNDKFMDESLKFPKILNF